MINYAFPKKRHTINSTCLGVMHWVKKVFLRKADTAFKLKNIPLTYWVHSNTYFSKQLTKFGSYEAENSNWVLENFANKKAGALFVDVGANFGWYSLILSVCADVSGRVISIEPEPENLRLLKKNIDTNNAHNITVIASGVGASEGSAELALNDQWNPGMHSLRKDLNPTNTVKIKISTLDSLLKDFPGEIDLLKMDIEGFEVDALMGASETLARTKNVMIEFTPKFIRACGRDPEQLLSIFETYNFLPYLINDGKLEMCTSKFLIDIDQKLAHKENPQVDIFYIRS
jgi:FkbM family methyltransferase